MGNTVYLARDDKKTLFDIGTWKDGFQDYFARRAGPPPPYQRLWRDIYGIVVFRDGWDLEPHDAATFAKQLADRITRWAGGQPIRVVVEGFDAPRGYRVNGDRYFRDIYYSIGERVELSRGRTGVIKKRVSTGWRDPDYQVRVDGSGELVRVTIDQMSKLGLLYQLLPED